MYGCIPDIVYIPLFCWQQQQIQVLDVQHVPEDLDVPIDKMNVRANSLPLVAQMMCSDLFVTKHRSYTYLLLTHAYSSPFL